MTNKIILFILAVVIIITLIFGIGVYTEIIGISNKEELIPLYVNPYDPAIYYQVFNDYDIEEYAEIGILTKENEIIYYQNITQFTDFFEQTQWIEFKSDNITYRILGEITLIKITNINTS